MFLLGICPKGIDILDLTGNTFLFLLDLHIPQKKYYIIPRPSIKHPQNGRQYVQMPTKPWFLRGV